MIFPSTAGGDEAFEAFDLIDEGPPAYLDGAFAVWIHGVGRYRATFGARGALLLR